MRDSHAEHEDGGQERGPVTTTDTGKRKKGESGGCDKRTDHQGQSGAIAVEKSSRAARQQEHQQNEWEQGRSRLGGRIAPHLIRSSGKKKRKPLRAE
jgi:hypothetical protein